MTARDVRECPHGGLSDTCPECGKRPAYHPHPEWFVNQHTKLFGVVANDADSVLSHGSGENMYHPHGITETAYREMIWDLIFSGRRILEERDHYRETAAERFAELCDLNSTRAALQADNERLRKMLAFAYSGTRLYGDDGELQDSRLPFPIDYVRDSVGQIETAIYNRGMAALAAGDEGGV